MTKLVDIKSNLEYLAKLDTDKKDRTITRNEYLSIERNSKLLEKLAGKSLFEGWSDFKEQFIGHQKSMGFKWSPTKGFGGPIKFYEIELSEEIGYELAEKCMKEKVEKGDLKDLFFGHLDGNGFITRDTIENESVIRQDSWNQLKEGFKSFHSQTYESYKFSAGRGYQFEKGKLFFEYTPAGSDASKKRISREFHFGEAIVKAVKAKLDLNFLEHTQNQSSSKKFENDDLRGLKILDAFTHQLTEIYNFELKPNNKVDSISQAISQAINYKRRSNFTYIVIPNFSESSFPDVDRLNFFKSMCENNQIGILSIEMNGKEELNESGMPKISDSDVILVLEAKKRNVEDTAQMIELMEAQKLEYCSLCKKIVCKENSPDSNFISCGWLVTAELNSGESVSECAKEGFNKLISKIIEDKNSI
jgi:hypothetical protein